MSHDEVTTFLQRLDKTLAKFRRKHAPIQPPLSADKEDQGMIHSLHPLTCCELVSTHTRQRYSGSRGLLYSFNCSTWLFVAMSDGVDYNT